MQMGNGAAVTLVRRKENATIATTMIDILH